MPSSFCSIAVFCGSNSGVDPTFKEAAVSLGRLLAKSHIRLVYGGGCVGLMGVLADAIARAFRQQRRQQRQKICALSGKYQWTKSATIRRDLDVRKWR
jgi:predicted Rossmann-fold nucleotide-binding protein